MLQAQVKRYTGLLVSGFRLRPFRGESIVRARKKDDPIRKVPRQELLEISEDHWTDRNARPGRRVIISERV